MESISEPILAPHLREGVGPITLRVRRETGETLHVTAHRSLTGSRVKLILSTSILYLRLKQACELLNHVGMYSHVPKQISIERRGGGIPWLSIDEGDEKSLEGCRFATKAKRHVKKIPLFITKTKGGRSSKFNGYASRPKGGTEITLVHRAKSKGYLFQDEAEALLRALKAPSNKSVSKRIEIGQKEGKRLWVRVDDEGKGGEAVGMYLKASRKRNSHPRTKDHSGVQMTQLNGESKPRTKVVSHRSSAVERAVNMTGRVKTWLSLYDEGKERQWVVEIKSEISLGKKIEIVYWHVKKKKVYLSAQEAKELLATLEIEKREVPKTMTIGVEEKDCLRVQLGEEDFQKIEGFTLSTQPVPERKEREEERGQDIEWEGKEGKLTLELETESE